MVTPSVTDPSSQSHPLLRFRKASQAIHATRALDKVLKRIIAELQSALDVEAASVALLDKTSGKAILHAAGPVAESISGLELPPGKGVIGWVIANEKTCIVNDVSSDSRFWPDVDGYSGFETRSILCAPLFSGNQIVGALEVLNKRRGDFTAEDSNFLEALGAVAASAVESAYRFQQEQQRRRETEALRRAWETLTVPRSLEELLEAIFDQLAQLVEYCSATILLVTDDGGLELRASRGIKDLDHATAMVSRLGIDVKIHTMLETRRPLLISDTRSDARWQHFPGFSYIRSWIGAPLLIKGHLIGTLNVDHDQPGFYNDDHVNIVTNFAHQAAIAIENTQLYAATHEATLQLAQQARRMVTLFETSRALLSGLELDWDDLYELISRITDLVDARYGILNILAEAHHPAMFITVSPPEAEIAGQALEVLEHNVLDLLSDELEVIRSHELGATFGNSHLLPPAVLNSFLAVAIHARGQLLGRILLAGRRDDQQFSRDDEALALALATNLAGAIENAKLYHNTRQRIRELTVLYELSHTVTQMKETHDLYAQLTTQVAKLLDAKKCAFFIYQDGILRCQPPGYGLPADIIPQLSFPILKDQNAYTIVHTPGALISNEATKDPELIEYRPLLARLKIERLISCQIPIDDERIGVLVAGDKRTGEEFSEQDRHLVSIMAHQVSNVLQRALLESHQREQAQVQAALLEVSHAISSLTDLDQLLQTVAHVTHRLVNCDHCLIASWEERYTAFIPRAQSGIAATFDATLSSIHLRPAEILCLDQLTESRQAILLSGKDIHETIPEPIRELMGSEHSLLVPLVNQDRVVGLITAAYMKQNLPPGDREIALVTGIARQAAIAIENANLFKDLQHHSMQLERAYRALKELDERKTQFIQNVSHELRTPFTLIKGYLELLLMEEMGSLSDRQKEGLAIVAEKTEAFGRLIDDIVAVQTIEARSLELHEINLRTLIQTILVNIADQGTVLELQTDLPSDLPLLSADPKLVERILQILLENAVKFSPDGGVVTIRARLEGDSVRVEVQDHGIGIPSRALPFLFEPFYQVDGSTTRRFGGTGLGLSIVKQVVEAHGGQVGVDSTEGQGSTFYFTLPVSSQTDNSP
jgi:GAF domain-containing protein